MARTREEITQALAKAENQSMNVALLVGQELTIEVLLDIRDLLSDIKQEMPSWEQLK